MERPTDKYINNLEGERTEADGHPHPRIVTGKVREEKGVGLVVNKGGQLDE